MSTQTECQRVVCESGFGAGHGAAALLLGAKRQARYYGFDLMSRPYAGRAHAYVQKLFDRATVEIVRGSSGVKAPQFFRSKIDEGTFATYDCVGSENVWLNLVLLCNSCVCVGAEIECDVVHIDGGRFQGIPLKDLETFHAHSREGAIVIMDDVRCDESNRHVCEGPGKAWSKMKLLGKIEEVACHVKKSEGVHFCVGKYKHTHE